MRPLGLVLAISTLLPLAAACGTDGGGSDDENLPSCEEDTRDEPYVAGMEKTGEAGYTITLMDSDNAPPAKGDNVWTVKVTDPNGEPVEGITFECLAYMPDHGHSSPVIPVVTEMGEGMYTLDPINLFMPGYWETTVTAVDAGATDSPDDDVDLDTVQFNFCVEG
jgi:hypothetical protein